MSVTDDLRRMLDERGVEHGDVESAPYPPYNSTRRMTTFWANKWVWQYIEDEREGGDIELEGRYMSMSVTPAQAIAATLGAGTCHNVSKVMDEHGQARFVCSECGAWIDFRMLWNPEYRNGESPWVSDCKLNFCPNCGRRIVEVDE